jgi:putative FmdB family regulatory protein
MALYDYQCKACGDVDEHIVSSTSGEPTKCEKCGAENALERVAGIPKTSFELRGRGWARDGYSTTHRART